MLVRLARRFELDHVAAAATYDALLTPGAGLAPDARLALEGFEAVLALRAEPEGHWTGVPPPPQRYLDLSHFERVLAM